jgi:hypothetical protein
MSPRAADGARESGGARESRGVAGGGPAGGTGSAGRPDARFPGLPTVRRQVGTDGVLASVVASVNVTAGTGAISFVHPVTGLPASGSDPDSAVVIRAVDAGDTVLEEFGVRVRLDSELEPGDDQGGLVSAVLPLPAQTQALLLVIRGQVADTFRVAGPPPGIRAIRPLGRQGRQMRIGVEFERPLESRQSYAVQVSADGGRTWQTTGVGLTGTTVSVDAGNLRPGQEIRVRVITTNGTAANETTSDPVRVEDASAGPA